MSHKRKERPSGKRRRSYVQYQHGLILSQSAREGIFMFSIFALIIGGIYACALLKSAGVI